MKRKEGASVVDGPGARRRVRLLLALCASLAVAAVGGCVMPGVEAESRAIAISNVVRLHDSALACFRGHIATYDEKADFAEHVARLNGRRCGSPRILNLDDTEIAELRRDRNGDPLPFVPGETDTWYTSATRTGSTGVVAVTTVGAGDGSSNPYKFPARKTLAVCWEIVVDIPTKSVEPVYDTGSCHDAVMWPDTEIVTWGTVLDEHAERDVNAG